LVRTALREKDHFEVSRARLTFFSLDQMRWIDRVIIVRHYLLAASSARLDDHKDMIICLEGRALVGLPMQYSTAEFDAGTAAHGLATAAGLGLTLVDIPF
jgi:hypothetical protein